MIYNHVISSNHVGSNDGVEHLVPLLVATLAEVRVCASGALEPRSADGLRTAIVTIDALVHIRVRVRGLFL